MSGTLALASAIAAFDRSALARLVTDRRPFSPSGVADPIGLATELLRPESIARALAPLDRESLRVLAAHDWDHSIRITQRLGALGLVGVDTAHGRAVALPEVDAALRSALTAVGVDCDALALEPSGGAGLASPALDADARAHAAGAWFTPALTSVGEAAECLRALQREGLRLNRSGAVGVAAARELADRTATTQASVMHAIRQLGYAGLTVSVEQRLLASARAIRWLELPHQARWLELARAFLATLPGPLRDSLTHFQSADLARMGEQLGDRFPLLPSADLAAAQQFVRDAEQLGCTALGELTVIAQALLAGENVSIDAVTQLLPPAATGVYLQPDLTVLAPGPLDPASEEALAELTRPEQIGPASMRRVTEASLAAAFERGTTPATAHETFSRLSLTGLPQPLEYLLTSVADRVGRIVVHEHMGAEGRSRIRVAQPTLAQTVLVDRQLQHLQLTRSPVEQPDAVVVLFSRLRAEHVVSAFNEARYHASIASAADEQREYRGFERRDPALPAPEKKQPSAATDQPEAPEQDPFEAMIERVFVAARTEPAAAAFARRLELAIRDKAAVQVTAEARGQRQTFTLTPVALTDGRLRGTDLKAGVERTFPVSMIVAVEPG